MAPPKKKKAGKKRANGMRGTSTLSGMTLDELFDEHGKFKFKNENVKVYPQVMVDAAFDLYCSGLSINDISKKWGIEMFTVNHWCTLYGWTERVKAIKEKARKKFDSKLVDEKVIERERADQRHKQITLWLMSEVQLELKTAAKDKTDEERKMTRMRTLKIATECMMPLIEQERKLLGIGDSANEVKIPTDFTYTVVSKGEVIEGDDIAKLLQNQNPHAYNGDAIIPTVLGLPEPSAPQLQQQASQAVDPIVIAARAQPAPGVEPAKERTIHDIIAEEQAQQSRNNFGFTGFNSGY